MKLLNTVPFVCSGLLFVSASGQFEPRVNSPSTPGEPVSSVMPYNPSDKGPNQYGGISDRYGGPVPGMGGFPTGLRSAATHHAATLADALGLTSAQAYKIQLIKTQESADLYALEPVPPKADENRIMLHAQDQIRAVLTAEQRANFNLIPEQYGGGLRGNTPWQELERLDQLVHLTPAQRQPVLDELIDGTENLMENQAPEKAAQAREIRLAMTVKVRTLLTLEQQKLLDDFLEKHRPKSGKS